MQSTSERHYRNDYGNFATIYECIDGYVLAMCPYGRSYTAYFSNLNEAKRAMRTLTNTKWREVSRA